MTTIALDPETYRRIEQIAEAAGIPVHDAADTAINNWIDVTSGSLLSITARIARAKAKAQAEAA